MAEKEVPNSIPYTDNQKPMTITELGRKTIEEFQGALDSPFVTALDEINEEAEGVLAVPKPITEEVKQATAEAIGKILANQETAKEASGEETPEIKIPYEKSPKKFTTNHVNMFLDHGAEMPYTSSAVNGGFYKAWIEQVPTASLRDWRDHAGRTISHYFDRRWNPPEFADIAAVRVRKLMYEIELTRRANLWSAQKKEDMLSSYLAEMIDLKTRYAEFISKFMYEDGHPLSDAADEKGLPY